MLILQYYNIIMPAIEGYFGNCHPENSPVDLGVVELEG
jgi:hypothetical protein